MLRGGARLALRRCVQDRANRSRQARQQPTPRERPFRTTPPMSQIAVDASSRCLPAPPEPCCTANHATALIVWIKYDLTRTKTAGYDLFPNVLTVYNARGRPVACHELTVITPGMSPPGTTRTFRNVHVAPVTW